MSTFYIGGSCSVSAFLKARLRLFLRGSSGMPLVYSGRGRLFVS